MTAEYGQLGSCQLAVGLGQTQSLLCRHTGRDTPL